MIPCFQGYDARFSAYHKKYFVGLQGFCAEFAPRFCVGGMWITLMASESIGTKITELKKIQNRVRVFIPPQGIISIWIDEKK